jgi:hypothetical protein
MRSTNPFAVLRLPSNASVAEIRSAAQRAVAMARLTGGEPGRNLRDVQEAADALRDPLVRFEAGLLWPGLGPAATALLRDHPDFADLASDASRDRSSAVERLCSGESGVGADHIRASFAILRARGLLEAEISTGGKPDASRASRMAKAGEVLAAGLAGCKRVFGSPEFWLAQRMRARELADPRLDTARIDRYRDEAWSIAVRPFIEIAQESLRRRDADACRALTSALSAQGPTGSRQPNPLEELYTPVCARIEAGIAPLKARLARASPHPEGWFAGILRDFSSDIQPDVELLIRVGDLPGTAEERARDEAAGFLRSLSIRSANEVDDYETAERAIDVALRLGHSSSVRKRLEEDKGTISKLAADARRLAGVKAHMDRFRRAIRAKDLREAVAALDAALKVEFGPARAELLTLRKTASSGLATELFNEGVELANRGEVVAARARMQEALKYETVASERKIIEQGLNSIGFGGGLARTGSSSGCAVLLAAGLCSLVTLPVAAVWLLAWGVHAIGALR